MSTIELMGILGIRSFSPNEEDFQKIRFFKPLTLIVGPNGTGKTTIIECLKYAATGDMPPGCKGAGASFVHDPKLIKAREIKGQVKLMICDVTGTKCTVERSMTSKVKDGKGKKTELKTLDGTLTRRNADGDTHSITSRCADLNKEMISALGVSKAVLDNVIFCHQEESNWPLGEGKALKDKFDAIFASTRYTKVLESIKKLKQSQDQEIREGKKELVFLKQNKNKAHQLATDLEEYEMKVAASEDEITQIKTKRKPITQRLTEIDARSADIQALENSKHEKISKMKQIEKTITDLSGKITEEFTGTMTELEKKLKQFSDEVQDKNVEIESCEVKQDKLASDIAKLAENINKLMMEIGRLQNEADTYTENLRKRDAKIHEVAQLYGFDGFEGDGNVSDGGYKQFLQSIKEKLENMMEEARRKKGDFEEEEGKLQVKIDGFRENKAKLENSERMKRDTMEKNKIEIKEIGQKLVHMISSESRLAGLNTELRREENNLQTTEAAVDMNDLKSEISDLDRRKKSLDDAISTLNYEMNRLHKQGGVHAQLTMLEGNREEKEATIAHLRATHEDNIVNLLGHMPVDDLRESIEVYISKQEESVRQYSAALGDLKTSVSTKDNEKTNIRTQLAQKEEELRRIEEKIDSRCEGRDLDDALEEVQGNLTVAQEEKGSMLGVEHMYTKYIRALERNNPDCPLCHRGFERAQETRELILKLQGDIRKLPANMKRAEQNMEKYQKEYDELMQLRPLKENVIGLKENDIPTLKMKMKKAEEDIKKLKDDRQAKDEQLMSLEIDLDIAKGLHSDVVLMDRYKGEVRDLERKIQAQKEMLVGGEPERTIEKVITEKEEQQLEVDTVNRSLQQKREKLSNHQDLTQKLRSKVNDLKGEKVTIEGELQQKKELENKKASLTGDNTTYQKEVDEARAQLKPIEIQIRKVLDEKTKISETKEIAMEDARNNVESLRDKGNAVKNLNKDIKAYCQSDKSNKLTDCQAKKTKQESLKATKDEEQVQLGGQVQQLKEEIARQQIRERCLQDTLTLRKMQGEIKDIMVQIKEVTEKLGGLDVGNLEKERQKLHKEDEALVRTYHAAVCREQEFRGQIKTTKKELDTYSDADQKYTQKMIAIKTLELANEDLQKYYKAMDTAIMRYHKSKMEEINMIIRELWKNTYTGNDIDSIEIQSEDIEAGSTSAGIQNRRNYNYRVVMIRDDVPMDMRGRCSAGQKVLTSLIIRLALAETFCVNCGILALDEPTTNLDRSNIESLALSLVQIIKERSSQRHFQLIVITHDEDFVELLGRSDYVEEYIQVSKDVLGASKLAVRKVESLHSRSPANGV